MAKHHKEPKLPVQQLLVLSFCRLAEPIALSSVFSYLPEMIESFHIPQQNVSKWAGIASAVFSLSQAVTGTLWGRAADTFGRKPTILVALTCTMICALLWGFSMSLAWAIVARSLAGASNGNVGTIRTTVAEMVPQKKLQPRAFSIMPLVWTIGTIFGPALGGVLAKPADKYPGVFGNSQFFSQFPFVLPNLIAAFLSLFGLSIGFLFMQETLAAKHDRRDYGLLLGQKLIVYMKKLWHRESPNDEQKSPLLRGSRPPSNLLDLHEDHATTPKPAPTHPSYTEIFTYQSSINLLVYALLALHSIAYDQLLPVFMHYPRQTNPHPNLTLPLKFTGGFGVNSDRIGLIQVCYGTVGMFIQFFVFPPLARRWGILRSLKMVVPIFPVVYIVTPFTALLPTPETQQISCFVVMLFKAWAVIFAFPCSTILLTNSASSLRILGTLNGLAVSVSALGRAAGPAIGGWTFSIGARTGYGVLPWWVLAILAAAAAAPVWWLVEMEGFGENANHGESSEDNDGLASPEEDPRKQLGSRRMSHEGQRPDESTPLNPQA